MRYMDEELRVSNVASGFERSEQQQHRLSTASIDEEEEDFQPIDIDRNLVSNMLKSLLSEGESAAGPASVLLHGVRMAKKEKQPSRAMCA